MSKSPVVISTIFAKTWLSVVSPFPVNLIPENKMDFDRVKSKDSNILDTRNRDHFDLAHVKNSSSIPESELNLRCKLISRIKTVFVNS